MPSFEAAIIIYHFVIIVNNFNIKLTKDFEFVIKKENKRKFFYKEQRKKIIRLRY